MAIETETVHHDHSGGHGHGHAVKEHPMQQGHFDTMDQQKDASGLGMWVFLIQEIMFFGGLFIAYLVYRNRYFDTFGIASTSALRTLLGAVNTVVLIGSSLTMALAVGTSALAAPVARGASIPVMATAGRSHNLDVSDP